LTQKIPPVERLTGKLLERFKQEREESISRLRGRALAQEKVSGSL
jgi:hypothetical protein